MATAATLYAHLMTRPGNSTRIYVCIKSTDLHEIYSYPNHNDYVDVPVCFMVIEFTKVLIVNFLFVFFYVTL